MATSVDNYYVLAAAFGLSLSTLVWSQPAVSNETHSASRPITAIDLVELREPEALQSSPDGRYVVFHLRQAIVETNRYLGEWYVMETRNPDSARKLSSSGTLRPRKTATGHIVGTVTATSRAKWSPDSERVAFLNEGSDGIQLWIANVVTGSNEQVTNESSDVLDFAWDLAGQSLVFRTARRSREEKRIDLHREGQRGYLYDQRFTPQYSVAPLSPPAASNQVWVIETETGYRRIADNEEREALAYRIQGQGLEDFPNARFVTVNDESSAIAWVNPTATLEDGFVPIHPIVQLMAARTDDRTNVTPCQVQQCLGLINAVWLNNAGTEVYFSRRQGHNQTEYGFYAWRVGSKKVRSIFDRSDEWLTDCVKAGDELFCIHETPVSPPKMVAITLTDGDLRVVYDPNPEFRNVQHSEHRRIEWENKELPWARRAYGHLILPLDYDPNKEYPLVIVQYYSQGYLRGGVGNEYPIHLLAAAGIAVFSIDRAIPWDLTARIADGVELQRILFTDEPNHWDAGLKSLETGLDLVLATGVVDPKRIGITGLSDGAVKALHGLVKSPHRYTAAAVSGTGWDPVLFFTTDHDHRRKLRLYGFGDPYSLGDNLWRRVSPIFSIERIQAPILFNISDHELISSVPLIAGLKEVDKVHEAYVYPGEYHAKWQPIHRFSSYRRNVQWFQFWLQGVETDDPVDPEQYARWRKMRAEHCDALKTESRDDLPIYCEYE